MVTTSGNVGIGRTPAANRLEVEGNASKTTASGWAANSDRRIKQDIRTVESALDTLNRVRLVSFRYTDDYRAAHPSVTDRPYLNVTAQGVAEEQGKELGQALLDGLVHFTEQHCFVCPAACLTRPDQRMESDFFADEHPAGLP